VVEQIEIRAHDVGSGGFAGGGGGFAGGFAASFAQRLFGVAVLGRSVRDACHALAVLCRDCCKSSTSRASAVHGLLKATRRAETRADVYADRLTRPAQIRPIYPLLPPLASGLGLVATLQPEPDNRSPHTPEQRSEAERQSEQEASGRRPGYRSAGAKAPRTEAGGEAQRGLW
jgi:hypothetical protein